MPHHITFNRSSTDPENRWSSKRSLGRCIGGRNSPAYMTICLGVYPGAYTIAIGSCGSTLYRLHSLHGGIAKCPCESVMVAAAWKQMSRELCAVKPCGSIGDSQ